MTKIRWVALLLIGSAEGAYAQQSTSSIPPTIGAEPRPEREGPGLDALGAIVRRVGIRASVNANYDSNVFGVNEALLGNRILPGRSKDDITISPALVLDILLPVGARQSAFLQGTIGYDFSLNNPNFNRERISLDGGANLSFGSCTGSVTAGFGRFRSTAADVFIVSPGAVEARNNALTRTSLGGQIRCGGAIGLTPSIGYNRTQIRNSSRLFKFNNSNQDVFDASLGYQRPSLGRISIFGTYSRGEFLGRDINFNPRTLPFSDDRNPLFNPNALDGVKSYSAGLRFERDIGSRAFGSVSAGYTWVDPISPLSQKFRGSTYAVALSLRPSDRFFVDLNASRTANIANNVFATFSITESYGLDGTYRLNERMSFNFGSSIQKRDFRIVARATDQQAFLSDDEFIRAYGGVNYDLNRRLRLNALISQQRRKTDNPLFGFNNTTVSVGASLALGR